MLAITSPAALTTHLEIYLWTYKMNKTMCLDNIRKKKKTEASKQSK